MGKMVSAFDSSDSLVGVIGCGIESSCKIEGLYTIKLWYNIQYKTKFNNCKLTETLISVLCSFKILLLDSGKVNRITDKNKVDMLSLFTSDTKLDYNGEIRQQLFRC